MGILKTIFSFFMDIIETVVVALCIFVVVYLFLMQPHQVVGNSMIPNFHDKEYILTDKFSYCRRGPMRGEVIVFESPEDADKEFIKRVIGLPGEGIKIENGKVLINGKILSEEYLDPDLRSPTGKFLHEGEDVVIPENSYAVFGDNRLNSSDSRTWGFIEGGQKCGFFGSSVIIGRAIFVYWPPNQARSVPKVTYR